MRTVSRRPSDKPVKRWNRNKNAGQGRVRLGECVRVSNHGAPLLPALISEPKGADTLLKSNEAYKLIFREYPDVVSVEQMCKMLGGISTKTAYRLLRQNQIKHFKIGRTYKIPKLHIFEYLAVAQESDA